MGDTEGGAESLEADASMVLSDLEREDRNRGEEKKVDERRR